MPPYPPTASDPPPDLDDRSGFAQGMSLGFRVLALAISGAIPALAGWWIDKQVGTGFVLLLIGLVLGFALMTYQLMGLVAELNQANRNERRR